MLTVEQVTSIEDKAKALLPANYIPCAQHDGCIEVYVGEGLDVDTVGEFVDFAALEQFVNDMRAKA